jgi:hypothetical protein
MECCKDILRWPHSLPGKKYSHDSCYYPLAQHKRRMHSRMQRIFEGAYAWVSKSQVVLGVFGVSFVLDADADVDVADVVDFLHQ